MELMKAQYLLRFDDVCPSMNWGVWDKIEAVLLRHRLTPILAVVPDNQDECLIVSAPNEKFWDRVRGWQARGWTIGMHGWQHRFLTHDGGILGVNQFSEFAGLPENEQEKKLQAGVAILRKQYVDCDLWIAPAHSFDLITIKILRQLGFRYISDGFFFFPRVDELGMTWIPQQLWSFRRRPLGVWTICFHINLWTQSDIAVFEEQITSYREMISSLPSIIDCYHGRRRTLIDSAAARLYRSAADAQQRVKHLTNMYVRRLPTETIRS